MEFEVQEENIAGWLDVFFARCETDIILRFACFLVKYLNHEGFTFYNFCHSVTGRSIAGTSYN